MGEDLVFNIQVFPHLRRIYCLDKVGYNYRFGGMTNKYNVNLLQDIKREFCLKEKLIEQYKYQKALYPACIEMKNVLKSDLCQQIIYKVETKQGIIDALEKELISPLWNRIASVGEANKCQDPFYMALIKKDVENMYQTCLGIVSKNRWRRRALKAASFICTHL